MWNKISNYRERFRKFWNEDGSYTFILVPDDGREFKRKTYEKESSGFAESFSSVRLRC